MNLLNWNSMEQEGATKDMKSMPGEDSLSKDLNSEHDMTLKRTSASSNIEHEGTVELEETLSDMENIPGEGSVAEHSELAHGKAATRYNSALDMTMKALCNIKVLKEDLVQNRQPFTENLEEEVPRALRDFFSAFISEEIKEEGVYSDLLSKLLTSVEEVDSLSSDAAEVGVAILEFLHCWKSSERESLVARLFTLEEHEGMSCRKCRRKSNYPDQSSYGIVMAADSIRELKCAFGNIKFEEISKIIRMEYKMLCDIKTGGCGKENFIHHTISRCPPIFTIMLEWDKNETENQIYETTNALDWEIDMSKLYECLEPNTKYRLVSLVKSKSGSQLLVQLILCISSLSTVSEYMTQVGSGEEGKYICMAYKKNRWVSLRHEGLAEEVVGNWNSLVRFCRERKVRPEILFYEALQCSNK